MKRPPPSVFVFWLIAAGVFGGTAAYLQYLGPPAPPKPAAPAATRAPSKPPPAAKPAPRLAARPASQPAPKPAAASTSAPAPAPAPTLHIASTLGTGSALAPGAPIPPPDPGLLTASGADPSWQVPQPGPNGAAPMRAYAAGAAALPAGTPRVSILVAGIGYNRELSLAALQFLPAAVSVALSPYGTHLADAAAAARASGHEMLMGIPLSAASTPAPANAAGGAGADALIPGAPPAQNARALDWALSRAQGYAGVTDAIGGTGAPGFLADPAARDWLLRQIGAHGLFFADSHPGDTLPAFAWSRDATVVMDPVAAPEAIGVQLQVLLAAARQDGTALGVLTTPAPDAVKALADWCNTLAGEGVALVPVSATVLAPDETPPGH